MLGGDAVLERACCLRSAKSKLKKVFAPLGSENRTSGLMDMPLMYLDMVSKCLEIVRVVAEWLSMRMILQGHV